MAKTVEQLSYKFNNDLTAFTVEYRILQTEPDCIVGPKTKDYSEWDTTKSLQTTQAEVQTDLENDEQV